MNQLDDFEKQLRDQLKGHVAPEPLMWSRLADALGRAKPWYAKSFFKYALTALTSLTIGAYLSFLFITHQPTKKHLSAALQTPPKQLGTNKQISLASTLTKVNSSSPTPPVTATSQYFEQDTAYLTMQDPIINSVPTDSFSTEQLGTLGLLNPAPVRVAQQSLIQNKRGILPSSRFSLSIANGAMKSNLPDFNFNLGPLAQYQSDQTSKFSPLVQLQIALFKNWHFNIGLQQQQQAITETFHQAEVFSYDDKEHFLFPYLYGYRKVSDEELEGGPWPFGPNPPGGSETSVVLANYRSTVQTNNLYLPVALSYHKQFGPFEAQLHAGLGLHFGYQNTQTLALNGYLPTTILLNTDFLQFHTSFQSQLRLNYLANRHLSVFIEPQFRTTFKQTKFITTNAYRAQSSGLYAGISWRF